MEVLRYLCEFFFTNFWHWLGLVVVLLILTGFIPHALISIRNIKQENCKETNYHSSNINKKDV